MTKFLLLQDSKLFKIPMMVLMGLTKLWNFNYKTEIMGASLTFFLIKIAHKKVYSQTFNWY